MEFISSDTNIWIDFLTIDRVKLPFMLPYTYIMYSESIENELLNPPDFLNTLRECGLVAVDLTADEFFLAEEYGPRYPALSVPDRVALAIAKLRGIVLMTGDGNLRKAAKAERVALFGTIGVLDQLYKENYIDAAEYGYCLNELSRFNGGVVRLPKGELTVRIQELQNKTGDVG